ncbi:beta family protein [Pseudovibrio ascidiaceicola]|uniref:beta family protein n=1 Tax=Pseudovibrio ascidiaceicola TaxID=285279 RepID=UPI003D35C69E
MLNRKLYVPFLKTRQQEILALSRLAENAKDFVFPFFIVPKIEFDAESGKKPKTIEEHLIITVQRYSKHWGSRHAWLGFDEDLLGMSSESQPSIVSFVFEKLRRQSARVIPAVNLSGTSHHVDCFARILKFDGNGCAFRVSWSELRKVDLNQKIEALCSRLSITKKEVDLVVECGSVDFESCEIFCNLLIQHLKKIKGLSEFRSFVFCSTSFPENLSDILAASRNTSVKERGVRKRGEWAFYKDFLLSEFAASNLRVPNFSDYTTIHPNYSLADFDPTKMTSSGKIVYTTDTSWQVFKGWSFKHNSLKMHKMCEALKNEEFFEGAQASWSDKLIADCAVEKIGPRNPAVWKGAGINRHISRVVKDLSNLHG